MRERVTRGGKRVPCWCVPIESGTFTPPRVRCCPACGHDFREDQMHFCPAVPDDLDRPATRRDVLAVLTALMNNLSALGHPRPEDAVQWTWEHFTTEWRQDARAHALTQVDHGQEHPTREG